MNPYTLPLYLIPALMTFIGALAEKRITQVICIVMATCVFWLLLQGSVDWAYTHPFNPDDGAARSFAILFGWFYGLLIVILPTYFITRFSKKRLNRKQ